MGEGQGHIAVAVGVVGGFGAVGGQQLKVFLKVLLCNLGLALHKLGLEESAVLLGQQLAHIPKGGRHVHPLTWLLVCKYKLLGLRVELLNRSVLALYKAGLGRFCQLALALGREIGHKGQLVFLRLTAF